MTYFSSGTEAYGRFVGRYSRQLAAAHADAAGVRVGDTALDVGCGSGPLLAELARRLGVDHVAGVDPSEPFVEQARAAVPGADVRHAAAEALPFEDGRFDVVMSQLVVNFMSDPARGVEEMRRVARRTVASCVWDYAGGMTMLHTFWEAAMATDPRAASEAQTMTFATPAGLEALWQEAGLREVTISELVVGADYVDFDDLWQPFLAGIGPSGTYALSLDEPGRAALRSEYFERLGAPSGPFRLAARAWFVRGEVT